MIHHFRPKPYPTSLRADLLLEIAAVKCQWCRVNPNMHHALLPLESNDRFPCCGLLGLPKLGNRHRLGNTVLSDSTLPW